MLLNNIRKVARLFLAIAGVLLFSTGLFAEIKAYPVPWIPDGGKVKEGGQSSTDGIVFSGLPSDGELLIYTTVGNFVRRVEFRNNTAGVLNLFGPSDNWEAIPSGVYVWKVKTSKVIKTGKIIVIR